MRVPTSDSFERPRDLIDKTDPMVLYALSLLWIRAVIGALGIALPVIFIVGEAYFLRGDVEIRGSLSAYFHTSMRDVFVAGLCVIGFFLLTYMSGQTNTWDFRLSLVAGVAVLGVVAFPKSRPDLIEGAARCGSEPMPPGCSPIQQQLGEQLVAGIHFTCAAIFILSLAFLCFVFAVREKNYKDSPELAVTLRVLGFVIIGAVVGTVVANLLNISIGGLTPLYVGEVVSVWAFGAAWLLKARDLKTRGWRRKPGNEGSAAEAG